MLFNVNTPAGHYRHTHQCSALFAQPRPDKPVT